MAEQANHVPDPAKAPAEVDPGRPRMSPRRVLWIASYLLAASLLALITLFDLWQAESAGPSRVTLTTPGSNGSPDEAGPRITDTLPDVLVRGHSLPVVALRGERFGEGARVTVSGELRQSGRVSDQELYVQLLPGDLAAPGLLLLEVTTPPTGSGETERLRSAAHGLLVVTDGDILFRWKPLFQAQKDITAEARLFLLVLLVGFLGACVSALISLANYAGERRLYPSWTLLYLFRPLVGAGMAFLFYLLIRGGLLAGTNAELGSSTPYGILAIAALAGMFVDRAALKLKAVFDTLFDAARDPRSDRIAAALKIVTEELQPGRVGAAYDDRLEATSESGDSLTWAASGLPPGLGLDASGRISGTPTEANTFEVRVTVVDRAGRGAEKALVLLIGAQ